MRRVARLRVLAVVTAGLFLIPLPALARPLEASSTFDSTRNMHSLGFSERVFDNSAGFAGANSDLAFWGRTAYQGNYDGFRILDVSAPANPKEIIDYRDCQGDQGDVIIWDDILVRSWNSPAPAGATCGGMPVPQGEEGVHVFDVSDPRNPEVLAFVPTECGSHTASGVPDPANDRLLVYSSPSNRNCEFFDIIEVPMANPAGASYVRAVPAMHTCHDIGVILGDVMKAACAGGAGTRVFSIGEESGDGTLDNPVLLFHTEEAGVTIGHSAGWTWDGEVLIFGHEPGGGAGARCQASSSAVDRTLFFYDGETGKRLGTILHPRPQTSTENCTWHNYNIVPTDKRYVMVSGNYQSGISVVDFTNPANAREIAYADPAPLSETQLILGGDWSTYWYNGFIYESDITRGLLIWNLSDKATAGAKKLGHLNPQTQEFTFSRK